MLNGVASDKEKLAMLLISLSPKENVCYDGDEKDTRINEEASEFGANTYIRHFEDFFNFYGINGHQSAKCQLADNFNLNKCIAKMLEIPHLGFSNQKLNLEVNAMVKSYVLFSRTLNSAH